MNNQTCNPKEYLLQNGVSIKLINSIEADAIEELKFPVMLRKMWSGGEVQDWLKEQADKLREGDDE